MEAVQFITHANERFGYLDGVRWALAGGCRWIQLRMKQATDEERHATALEIQELCRRAQATFIIDDDVHLTQIIHADGVHLGKSDMPIAEARALLGKDFIIGATANTFEDIAAHHRAGANYIGCGPFRFTTTKEKLSPILGAEGYQHILSKMAAHHIDLPLVAIGGITEEDLPTLKAVGIRHIAISGTVLRAEHPDKAMQQLIHLMTS